jgi:hypothetical protein
MAYMSYWATRLCWWEIIFRFGQRCATLGGVLPVTPALQQMLFEFRKGLERIYGPRLAGLVLFGSQARGDALPDSDIDVMVVLHGPVSPLERPGVLVGSEAISVCATAW